MTKPAGAPAQHINRNISVMEDQHKVKLITQTAKMKHKNQLCLALSLCPQRLFFHPQLALYFQLFPLVGDSFRRLPLPTNTTMLCFLNRLPVTKLIRSRSRPPSQGPLPTKYNEGSQIPEFPKGWGGGNTHRHTEERNSQKKYMGRHWEGWFHSS